MKYTMKSSKTTRMTTQQAIRTICSSSFRKPFRSEAFPPDFSVGKAVELGSLGGRVVVGFA